jgi:hypothetical protein
VTLRESQTGKALSKGSRSTKAKEASMDARMRSNTGWTLVVVMLVLGLTLGMTMVAQAGETSSEFSGHHVNSGTVNHDIIAGKHVLTMSKDFPVPEAPDPHWRVVDTKGNVYLLDRVKLKDDKISRTITLPAYIPDVAKVQFWCAFVEVVLGEASFAKPLALRTTR